MRRQLPTALAYPTRGTPPRKYCSRGIVCLLVEHQPATRSFTDSIPAGGTLEVWPWTYVASGLWGGSPRLGSGARRSGNVRAGQSRMMADPMGRVKRDGGLRWDSSGNTPASVIPHMITVTGIRCLATGANLNGAIELDWRSNRGAGKPAASSESP